MRKSTVVFFLFFIFPAISMAQLQINGKVSDAKSGEPLPGSHIVLKGTQLLTTANEQGEFEFKDIPKGDYQFVVSYIGYKKLKQDVRIDKDLVLDFKLKTQAITGEEVIIRSTRALDNTPTTYQNISREEIQENDMGQDLPYLISLTPSMVVTSDAGAGVGYTAMRIRGSDQSRINVTINGVPLNDPESQSVYWVDLPDFGSSVENIQIQRGVGASTNGAAAFGATVNLQTAKLRANPYAEINSTAGTFNTFRNNVRFGTGLIKGKFAFDGRLSKISSDGYVDRATSNLKSFFVSGGYYGDKTLMKLNIFSGKEITYQAWNGVPKDMLETNRRFNPSGMYFGPDGDTLYYDNEVDDYKQDHFQFFFVHEFNEKLNVHAALHYTHGFGYYENYKMGESFSKYGLDDVIIGGDTITESDIITRKYLDNHFYGGVFSLNYENKRMKLTAGGGGNYYDGGHYGNIIWAQYASNGSIDRDWYNNDGIKKDFNTYAKFNYLLTEKLNLYADLQYRHVDYEINGTHDDLRDISQEHQFDFLNPKAGLHYDFNKHHAAYFSIAIANREPSRNNYRDADENHVPEAEKLTDYELGYEFKSSKFSANANLYYMNYTDQLVLTGEINNVGDAIMANVPESYRAGIELAAGWQINKLLRWDVNFTFSQNKIKDFAEYVDNWSYWDDPENQPLQYEKYLGETDISFSPDIIAGSVIKLKPFKNFGISFISKYVGRQYIDNTSSKERSLDPYFVNNIHLNYRLKTSLVKKIDFFLRLNNVFSEKYESNAWVYRYYYDGVEGEVNGYFPQAEFNFLGGIRITLE